MSFGLGHGRSLDPGHVAVTPVELPTINDDAIGHPELARVDPRAWFPEPRAPFEIEIGSGKGTFAIQHASNHPDVNLLGIEYAREFFLYAADRIRRRGLTNVRMLHADAIEFLRWRCPDGLARVIHLYYSDPWPKKRHHKNRVIQDRFLADAWRALAPGGEIRIVTDHPELWAWCQDHFHRWTNADPHARPAGPWDPRPPFVLRAFSPPSWTDEDEVIGTNYERKTRAAGFEPNAAVLVKA